jgi:translation initiation factor IF-2
VAKKRLFQVAREYKITSEALLKMLRGLGFKVKSHMSSATPEILEAIEKQFKKEQESIKQEIATKTKKIKERERKEYAEYRKIKEPPDDKEKALRIKQLETKQREEREKKKKRRRDKKKKKKARVIDQKAVAENVKKTLARMDTGARKPKHKRKPQKESVVEVEDENVIHVNEYMSVAELANELGIKATDLIAKCMSLGMMVSINQRLDMDTIEMLALEYGKKIKEIKELGAEELVEEEEEEEEADMRPRPPVVTVMGHVDHGKTSLLDYIRETHVAEGEAGAITQHIGAYRVKLSGGDITFLDTPGHAAFTAMRARGAQITDIVVLVVAANDSVQQQTIEAINHARAAGVPIIVAINKMDLPDANADLVRQALAQQRLTPEEWGGKTVMVEISAKTGEGIDTLLENILLQADVLELKANYNTRAKGIVVEAKLEKGKGSVTTIIVEDGILQVGEPLVVGNHFGRVRAIMDDRGTNLEAVYPGWPAQITGTHGIPQAGDNFFVPQDESVAREIATRRQRIKREQDFRQMKRFALTDVFERIKEGEVVDLNIVIKGDVDGSVEVLADTLQNLSTSEVQVQIIHRGVGAINENDVLLAAASNAIIIGFHVRPDARARELAVREKVDIRLYTVIYDIQSDITAALEGLLAPEIKEEIRGTAEVRDTFRIPKVGTIAGCYITSGKIGRNDSIRVIRDGVNVYEGDIGSLKRFKDDAREVAAGFECGISVNGFNDIKVGDILEAYVEVEVSRKL